jgi:DNA-binding LacI/PurR family transcriptional regulator
MRAVAGDTSDQAPQAPPAEVSTIREVAQMADVSISTVSRAFNQPKKVQADTRDRVMAAAKSLDYSPNRLARGLITGRTGSIGLVVPDVTNPFFPAMIRAAQARARASAYTCILVDTDEDGYVEARVVEQISRQVDGLVVCSSRMDAEALVRTSELTTTVFVQRPVPGATMVILDVEPGMRQAVAHLHALGHRRVAYVGGPSASWSDLERRRTARSATEEMGMELTELGPFQPQFGGGVQAADIVIAQGTTGVVAYNDLVALGIISRLTNRGRRVPEDISVVGFDDIPMAEMSLPALTTVAMPVAAAGRMAVELLLDLLDGGRSPVGEFIRLPTHLVVRGSTGSAVE